MKGSDSQHPTDRRLFLKGVVAAGGATALAAAVSAPHGEDPLTATEAAPDADSGGLSPGYRETAHIRAYYQTLRD